MSVRSTSQWLDSFRTQSVSAVNTLKAAKKISITGGKGGVGKTSISLKIAKSLAQLGQRVLLIDCDFNMSNTAIKLGLPLNDNFSAMIRAEKDFEDCLYRDDSFHLLSACNGSLEIFDSKLNFEEVIIDIICSHESSYDFILLDCPAGMSKASLVLNAYCDDRFMVVTPDRSSITDSYALIKVLYQKFSIKTNSLIVNKFKEVKQFNRVVKTLSETVEQFLGGRTLLFSGIPLINENKHEFDTFFLDGKEKKDFEKFIKAVEDLADRESATRAEMYRKLNARVRHEQEVRQTI